MTKKVISTGGHNIIGGLSRVFHCNFYNAYLQMAVLMIQGTEKYGPEQLLTDSITNLVNLLKQQGYSDDELVQEFAHCGFGKLQQLDVNTWITPRSHYGEVLCMMHGKPQINCYFTSGYLQGLLNKTVKETECKLLGADADKFSVGADLPPIENYLINDFELQTDIPERFTIGQNFETNVDENKIIATLQELPLYGDAESGLIEAFGAVLTNHFADYYNRISYESYFNLCKVGIPEEDSKEMFIQAGHICAFNTFGRIMTSPEWYDLIVPMCSNKEDWLHGMIAVLNGLGWGIYRIERVAGEDEFIVRVYNSYEGVGYRRMYPQTDDKNISFLAMGATLGLVHLLWKVDIRNKPELTQEFYVDQFNHPENSYMIEQTHAIAAGDEYDRFIVSK
ncbi:hypothetical protein QUF74_18790 [Candidatus Halobeggiatoa sp. HSG11]|nr:hypothetical protein [Candidatus Halobeggiatoa sp. HSG11]